MSSSQAEKIVARRVRARADSIASAFIIDPLRSPPQGLEGVPSERHLASNRGSVLWYLQFVQPYRKLLIMQSRLLCHPAQIAFWMYRITYKIIVLASCMR